MKLAHSVRVTARFHAGKFCKEADVSMPVSSSLDELLGELKTLVSAPQISTRWKIATVAGRSIDTTVPLSSTPLCDGSIIVFSPEEPAAGVVIRDSAEALSRQRTESALSGVLSAWFYVGLIILAALLQVLVPGDSWWPGLALISVGGFVVSCWQREFTALPVLSTIAAGGAGYLGIIDAPVPTKVTEGAWQSSTLDEALGLAFSWLLPDSEMTLSWAMVGAAGCAVAFTGSFHAIGRIRIQTAIAILTTSLLLCVAAAGVHLIGPVSGPTVGVNLGPASLIAGASVSLGVAIFIFITAPSWTLSLAGLKVPQLPTAGQDLSVSDGSDPNVDKKALRALEVYDGISLGLTVVCIPAVALIALCGSSIMTPLGPVLGQNGEGALFAFALLIALSGATVLHAARHHRNTARWCLMSVSMVSVLGTVILIAQNSYLASANTPTWTLAIISALLALACVSCLWWSPRMSSMEPTTLAWWERAEALSVAICLPLALHLTGIFIIIRGLGS